MTPQEKIAEARKVLREFADDPAEKALLTGNEWTAWKNEMLKSIFLALRILERCNEKILVNIKLPYPATFTKASIGTEKDYTEITLSYESAQAIIERMVEE